MQNLQARRKNQNQKHIPIWKMLKVPKIFEMQTIQLTENGLKRVTAGLFIYARALKFLISHMGTKLISFRF